MLSGCRITVLLLLPLLLVVMTAVTKAQSGDEDIESSISCASHITTRTSTLTCKLVRDEVDSEDDEDQQTDDIEEMKACYTALNSVLRCVKSDRDTITFTDLSPVILLEVTFTFNTGRILKKMIDLTKIVKPESPQVWNVTFLLEPYQALIHVGTPYLNDYLETQKQLFQLYIWSATYSMTQNISSLDKIVMRIDEAHLRKNTKYHVKVRSIPKVGLQGTWSEWSKPYNFSTPPENNQIQIQIQILWEKNTLIVCLILILVVTSSVIVSLKNKIITYVWPSIPHPKQTFLQICNPNTGLLLNVKPDVFSVPKVYSMEKIDPEPVAESEPLDAADVDQSSFPSSSSSQSSRSVDSVSTEDLELSALLSRSSSEEEGSLQSAAPSPVEAPGSPQSVWGSEGKGTVFGVSKQEEAYVTMSSFYQINKSVQKQ